MVKIIFHGPLVQRFGNTMEITNVSSIDDIIKKLNLNNTEQEAASTISGYIILVNGKDWRIYNNNLKNSDVIDLIPINHGG